MISSREQILGPVVALQRVEPVKPGTGGREKTCVVFNMG
jgi:hypothetical protein